MPEQTAHIFEGMTSIRALITAWQTQPGARKILRIVYDQHRAEAKPKELAYLRHRAEDMRFSLDVVPSDIIDQYASGNTHGGVLAECGEKPIPTLSAEHILPKGFYLLLEGIEDPFNFGYALRSVYAAGADGVVLSPRNWMRAAGTVCRSSAGASELMPLYTASGDEAARLFTQAGYKIVCADLKNAVSLYDADLHKPVFLIVGGEKRGISRTTLNAADTIVRIDYGREFGASLSAASAATILAYEVYRQNRP